jgi:predicted transcriptional regulator
MYRNKQQINQTILDTVLMSGSEGITITPLLRQSNLPFKRATGFIDKLTQNNLINEIVISDVKKVFIITERGKILLEEYKKFNMIAESFGLEL